MQENNVSTFDFEHCLKCTVCVDVCPMHEANPLYPGPKQAGPDGERYRLKSPEYFDAALKYCLGCKRCEVACPSGVKIADLISRARIDYGSNSNPLRDWALANTDLVGSLASPFAPIVNPVLGLAPVKKVMDAFGVAQERTFPSYSREKFVDWFRSPQAPSQEGFGRYVTLFHGCYVNYNHPALGQDAVRLLNACGYGVRLMEKEKCCGVALIANRFESQAARQAEINVDSMRSALAGGSEAVVSCSSSCTFTMRDEYPHLLGIDNSDVRDSLMLLTRFIFRKIEAGEIRLAFKPGWKGTMAYHTPCHMQRMGWQVYSISLLRMIPGLTLTVLNQECCGIAGTFGFKKENYKWSQKIGSKLFALVRESGAGAVATDCETCKWQIEAGTGLKVYNPVEVLVSALDLEQTFKLNNGR